MAVRRWGPVRGAGHLGHAFKGLVLSGPSLTPCLLHAGTFYIMIAQKAMDRPTTGLKPLEPSARINPIPTSSPV